MYQIALVDVHYTFSSNLKIEIFIRVKLSIFLIKAISPTVKRTKFDLVSIITIHSRWG